MGGPGAEIPFEYRDGLIWLKVRAEGAQEPLNFLLDSGAGVSVIDLGAAQRLGLKLASRVAVRGVQSETTGHWPQRLNAAASGVPLPPDFLALDLQKLSKACAHPVDGLVGADFFRERVVQVDFGAGKVRLLDAAPAKADEVLPIEIQKDVLRVPVAVNGGKPQWMRLDTGCASALQWVSTARPAVTAATRRRLSVGLAEVPVVMASTTVALGKLRFDEVPTGVHSKQIFSGEAGLLGNGLLSRFIVTVDALNKRLLLAKPPAADR
jgi:predicted aspartyl protease